MKLYRIRPISDLGLDSYSCAVVCAENEELARRMIPSGYGYLPTFAACERGKIDVTYKGGTWPNDPREVKAVYLGEADAGMEPGVICASYHAG